MPSWSLVFVVLFPFNRCGLLFIRWLFCFFSLSFYSLPGAGGVMLAQWDGEGRNMQESFLVHIRICFFSFVAPLRLNGCWLLLLSCVQGSKSQDFCGEEGAK
jgi:hypothetical protein